LTGRSCQGGPARLVNHSWWRCIGQEQGRATERSDLTLVVRPVITRKEGAGWLRNQTLERSCDRTHRGCVRSSVTYAGISIASESREAECGPDTGARQVNVDRTRPVREFRLWILTGLDQTLCSPESGHFEQCVRYHFNHASEMF
jgi:hypothetical protein